MTAAAMIFGMMPMAIGFGEGGGAIRAAGPRRHRRPDRFHLRHADHPAFDLRDPAGQGLDCFSSLNPMDPASRYYDATLDSSCPQCMLLAAALLSRPPSPRAPDLRPVVSKAVSRPWICRASSSPSSASRCTRRVPGYVEKVLVDRGSVVKQGQLLAELSAPEMAAQIAEAESKVQAAESDRLQAEAQLAAAQSTYDAEESGGNPGRHRRQRTDAGGKTGGRRARPG